MPWLLVDLALVLLALAVLGLSGLRLYRSVRALGRGAATAAGVVGAATERLAGLQADVERARAERDAPEPTVVASRSPSRRSPATAGTAAQARRRVR